MAKLPAIQFYPGDWRKDPGIQSLSYEERGVWFEMLLIMFESEQRGRLILNGKPISDDRLARLLGLDNQTCNQILTTLIELGVASREQETGIIYSRRMVRDEELSQIRREAGKKGGNPNLVNQNSTTGVNQNPTPSSSSSSSSSDIKKNKQKKKSAHEYSDEFEQAWALYPKRAGSNPKTEAFKSWKARVAEGVSPWDMIAGVQSYSAYIEATNKAGTEYVLQGSTFFGPSKRFDEQWEVPRETSKPTSKQLTDEAMRQQREYIEREFGNQSPHGSGQTFEGESVGGHDGFVQRPLDQQVGFNS